MLLFCDYFLIENYMDSYGKASGDLLNFAANNQIKSVDNFLMARHGCSKRLNESDVSQRIIAELTPLPPAPEQRHAMRP